MNKDKKAIVLTSGGLDSTTVLAIAKNQGYALYSISFDYGQRHRFELEAAHRVARALSVAKHLVVSLDLATIAESALTSDISVPKRRDLNDIPSGIPATYVPARNTIFLSHALAWAETIVSADIFIGVNAVDYSGYPDCRPEFIASFQSMANLATKVSIEDKLQIKVHAPLMHMDKARIIQTGVGLGVDYGLTHSCYDPDIDGLACGQCDSCILRLKGFDQAGIADPIDYRDRK